MSTKLMSPLPLTSESTSESTSELEDKPEELLLRRYNIINEYKRS
jgi:hypothetical protein